MPEKFAYGLAERVGAIWARRGSKRTQVARNLARITGRPVDSELVRSLVLGSHRSYPRYWLETFRLVREGREFFLDRFECKHEDRIDAVMERGKGAIVVVGHMGNWDAAGAWG